MAATVGRGAGVCGSVGAITRSARRSNRSAAAGDPKRRDFAHESKRARKTQKPRTIVGKERCHDEEYRGLKPIAGPGGNPEATCTVIFTKIGPINISVLDEH